MGSVHPYARGSFSVESDSTKYQLISNEQPNGHVSANSISGKVIERILPWDERKLCRLNYT